MGHRQGASALPLPFRRTNGGGLGDGDLQPEAAPHSTIRISGRATGQEHETPAPTPYSLPSPFCTPSPRPQSVCAIPRSLPNSNVETATHRVSLIPTMPHQGHPLAPRQPLTLPLYPPLLLTLPPTLTPAESNSESDPNILNCAPTNESHTDTWGKHGQAKVVSPHRTRPHMGQSRAYPGGRKLATELRSGQETVAIQSNPRRVRVPATLWGHGQNGRRWDAAKRDPVACGIPRHQLHLEGLESVGAGGCGVLRLGSARGGALQHVTCLAVLIPPQTKLMMRCLPRTLRRSVWVMRAERVLHVHCGGAILQPFGEAPAVPGERPTPPVVVVLKNCVSSFHGGQLLGCCWLSPLLCLIFA